MILSRRLYMIGFLCALALALVGCQSGDLKIGLADLPEGNADHGSEIFLHGTNGSIQCGSCHRTDALDKVGPGLGGIRERAASRVQGESAKEYLYLSILRPARFLVSGFTNLMPADFEDKFTAQDVADLIAYMMTL